MTYTPEFRKQIADEMTQIMLDPASDAFTLAEILHAALRKFTLTAKERRALRRKAETEEK